MKHLLVLLQPGLRKTVVLGGLTLLAEIAGIVGLFVGVMPPELFDSYTIKVLGFGGGIFAIGNVIEHVAKKA